MKNKAARKIKQIPEGYLMVGIDPHKKKHAAVAMTQDFMVKNKFKFTNSKHGYEEALERVRWEMRSNGCRGVIFAIETASHYWRNLAYFLDERGIPFRLINQFTLKRRREGKDIDRKKNDLRDAEAAAQLLRSGEFTETQLPQGIYAELRATYNAYRRLIKEGSRIKNLIKGLLDGLFPEFTQVFKDPCGLTALSVLSICPIPNVITGMTEEGFLNIIRQECKGRLMKKKLRVLHNIARNSIGIAVGAHSLAMEISFLAEKLALINSQVHQTEKTLMKLVDETEEGKYLLSIRGLGYISVAGMLAELGLFSSYHSAKQLVKMGGTNPTESESAGKRKSRTPMSKKGRPGLRWCGWTAAVSLLRHNPDFRFWAKRLQERPIHANPLNGKEMTGAAINKLLRLAFALVKNKTFYRLPEMTEMKV